MTESKRGDRGFFVEMADVDLEAEPVSDDSGDDDDDGSRVDDGAACADG